MEDIDEALFITTTELRTKTKWLVDTLKEGKKVYLIHRSKVVATITPVNPPRKMK